MPDDPTQPVSALEEIGDELDQFAANETSATLEIPTRRVLECFGRERRGSIVNRRIKGWLEENGLAMHPEIQDADFYGSVIVSRISSASEIQTKKIEDHSPIQSDDIVNGNWFLSSLKDDADPLDFLTYGQSAIDAVTLMKKKSRSKLPVFFSETDRSTLIGTVLVQDLTFDDTEEKSRLIDRATANVPILSTHEKLLDCVPMILQHGFIYGKDQDGQIVQIYTTHDVATYLSSIAELFLRVNEIEELIRKLLNNVPDGEAKRAVQSIHSLQSIPSELSGYILTPEEVQPGASGDGKYIDSLTFAQYMKCVGSDEIWNRYIRPSLASSLSKDQCIRSMNDARLARNNVMHFNGGESAKSLIPSLEVLAVWLRQANIPNH